MKEYVDLTVTNTPAIMEYFTETQANTQKQLEPALPR